MKWMKRVVYYSSLVCLVLAAVFLYFPTSKISSVELVENIDLIGNMSGLRLSKSKEILTKNKSFIDFSDPENSDSNIGLLSQNIERIYWGFDELGKINPKQSAVVTEILSKVNGGIRKYISRDTPIEVTYENGLLVAKMVGHDFQFSDKFHYHASDYTLAKASLAESNESAVEVVGKRRLLTLDDNKFVLPIKELSKIKFRQLTLELTSIVQGNTNFDEGVWQPANDCRIEGYSNGVSSVTDSESSRGQSLGIVSQNSNRTCASKTFDVALDPDKYYRLSFDYKNLQGEKIQFYYNLRKEDSLESRNYQKFVSKVVKLGEWATYDYIIKPPFEGVNKFDLFFYASSADEENTKNLYDNVILQSWVPSDIQSYYIDGTINRGRGMDSAHIKYVSVNPWTNEVVLSGVRTSALLSGIGPYSKYWILTDNSNQFIRLFNNSTKFNSHFKLNDFNNAWLVDVQLCDKNVSCTRNDDGSWNIKLRLINVFYEYIYRSLIVSATIFFLSLSYLGYSGIRSYRQRKALRQS